MNVGQLNVLVEAKGRPSLAIQWGAWGDVGMAATMTDAMRLRRGILKLPWGWSNWKTEGSTGPEPN